MFSSCVGFLCFVKRLSVGAVLKHCIKESLIFVILNKKFHPCLKWSFLIVVHDLMDIIWLLKQFIFDLV